MLSVKVYLLRDECTALIWASRKGHEKVVDLLSQPGANLAAVDKWLSEIDQFCFSKCFFERWERRFWFERSYFKTRERGRVKLWCVRSIWFDMRCISLSLKNIFHTHNMVFRLTENFLVASEGPTFMKIALFTMFSVPSQPPLEWVSTVKKYHLFTSWS